MEAKNEKCSNKENWREKSRCCRRLKHTHKRSVRRKNESRKNRGWKRVEGQERMGERERNAGAERTGGHNYVRRKKTPKYGPEMWKVKSQGRVWGEGGRERQKEVGGRN